MQTELGRLEERARREGEEHARRQMQTELGQREERARREGEEYARRQMQTELGRLEERARREGEEYARRQMQTELGRLEERARREGEEYARRQMQTELGQLEEETRREALRSALIAVVTSRFPAQPEEVLARIQRLEDPDVLRELIGGVAVATTLEEVERLLSTSDGSSTARGDASQEA
jgi:hypothetical protein